MADSCDLRLYYTGFYGDSLATMKVTAMELNKPVDEQKFFYSNYDPEKEGYVKSDSKAGSRIYTLADLNVDESTRKKATICLTSALRWTSHIRAMTIWFVHH